MSRDIEELKRLMELYDRAMQGDVEACIEVSKYILNDEVERLLDTNE